VHQRSSVSVRVEGIEPLVVMRDEVETVREDETGQRPCTDQWYGVLSHLHCRVVAMEQVEVVERKREEEGEGGRTHTVTEGQGTERGQEEERSEGLHWNE
jgi:hypothetical protein